MLRFTEDTSSYRELGAKSTQLDSSSCSLSLLQEMAVSLWEKNWEGGGGGNTGYL